MKQHRTKALAYLAANYSEWPAEGETWHTPRAHHGYSWVFTDEDGWFLESELYPDRITEQDYQAELAKVQISCSPESNGKGFLLRIEGCNGIDCYTLSNDDFAKMVSGQLGVAVIQK